MDHECTMRVVEVIWGDQFQKCYQSEEPVYPGVDGAVVYEITTPLMGPYRVYQPFKKGNHGQVNERNVWGWDGNKEEPTLTPSFALDCSPQYRAHLFFTKGKVELLADSTVTLISEGSKSL